MKDRLRLWPMKALAALALACGAFPVPALLGRWLYPDDPLLWWLPFALAYLWGAGGYLLPKKARLPWTALGCALAVGLIGFFLAAQDALPKTILYSLNTNDNAAIDCQRCPA